MFDKDTLPKEVFALRTSRIVGNEIRTYTGVCSPGGMTAYEWAVGAINRIAICGVGQKHEADECSIDFLAENGDLLGELPISRRAFKYARRQWKFTLEKQTNQ